MVKWGLRKQISNSWLPYQARLGFASAPHFSCLYFLVTKLKSKENDVLDGVSVRPLDAENLHDHSSVLAVNKSMQNVQTPPIEPTRISIVSPSALILKPSYLALS